MMYRHSINGEKFDSGPEGIPGNPYQDDILRNIGIIQTLGVTSVVSFAVKTVLL